MNSCDIRIFVPRDVHVSGESTIGSRIFAGLKQYNGSNRNKIIVRFVKKAPNLADLKVFHK